MRATEREREKGALSPAVNRNRAGTVKWACYWAWRGYVFSRHKMGYIKDDLQDGWGINK